MKIIAHRGASGYQPENTLAAFAQAIEMHADMIELDVYQIKAGELVVIHDHSVRRTTNGRGKVEQFSLEDLRALDAGKGEKVPLLSEVIELVDKKMPINIELKGSHTAEPVASLLKRYFAKGWSPEQFQISSFDHREVRRFMKHLPEVAAGALHNKRPFWLRPLSYHPRLATINFNQQYVTYTEIALAHRLGKKVYVYTINSSTKARRMRALGVDGIFTNYPDILQAEIEPVASTDPAENALPS